MIGAFDRLPVLAASLSDGINCKASFLRDDIARRGINPSNERALTAYRRIAHSHCTALAGQSAERIRPMPAMASRPAILPKTKARKIETALGAVT